MNHPPRITPLYGVVIDRLLVVEDGNKGIQNEVHPFCRIIHSAQSLDHAMGLLVKEDVEVFIIDCDFAGPVGEKDLYTLLYQCEQPPMLIAVASDPQNFGEMIHYPAVIALEKPLQFATLMSAIPEPLKQSKGSVLRLEDYLQMLSFGRHSVRIEVEISDGTQGYVDLLEGRIIQARFADQKGRSALRSLVLTSAKGINMLPRAHKSVPISDEFNESVPALLLEIMAEEDEANVSQADFDFNFPLGATEASNFESLIGRAMEAYLERDLEKSEVLFQQCLELRPNNSRCLHNLDRIRRKKGH